MVTERLLVPDTPLDDHTNIPKLPGPSRHALRLDAGHFLEERSPSLTQDVHRNPSPSAPLYMTRSLKSAGVSARHLGGGAGRKEVWMMHSEWEVREWCSSRLSLDFNSRFSTCSALRW